MGIALLATLIYLRVNDPNPNKRSHLFSKKYGHRLRKANVIERLK